MIEDNKIKISIIVEEPGLQDYIALILIGEGYEVKSYFTQNDALANLDKEVPALIISDFQSPNINGLDILKTLRRNFLFQYVPVIFILEETEPLNKARLIYAGADDYIQKSLIEEELLLRVKLNLYRISRQQDIDPITRLPGQNSLWRDLEKRIESKSIFAVCYSDLYKFKEFNQRYGFKKGDEVIKYTASLILKFLKESGSPSDFLAQVQGDDFIFITPPEGVEAIVNKIIKGFDAGITSFYDEADRKRGFILIKNRKGEIQKIPILRLSIGIVTNEYYPFFNPAQIIQIANELKDFAQKKFEKSIYVKERRKSYPFS
jgi:diguanylate cyclase (GGDEF)-like protein